MKAPRRRSAQYDATLVYLDEPQVMTLVSGKSRVVAIAVPAKRDGEFLFYATSVSQKDWLKYLNGAVDLRYLFTFPDRRNAYTFDLSTMKDGNVFMEPFLENAPEDFLPSPRFFSSNHTEEYAHVERPDEVSRLLVDGEWELVEFGQFNQRYSDIYAFSIALKGWENPHTPLRLKQAIRKPFLDRPYQGGFSYVHLFSDLNDNVPVSEQLSLDKIQYASPGYVDMFGKRETFEELQEIILNFLERRREIIKTYSEIYGFLYKNGYLKMPGDQYDKGGPSEAHIKLKTRELNSLLKIGKIETIDGLTNGNALVAAKVVLSFYRRINEVASFFAQGRVSFD